ncbi:MAG TPA: glutathione S-transferase [Psychrobacter sp.]|uniref:Glutathionine S-transferase n=1 Tax=Psychrobacter pasteurii TaxID=1945520 RepID=A0A1R4EIB1_9GAMM|nr:glutathione S-transferase N-terminal domain-containing protein [Psychrobacter pasteurii]SJM38226.1 glutathionine S-transferase [Psychrobacter pasteurii]HAO59142.1 glutathione S-transferase [Psychrobacter sp.]
MKKLYLTRMAPNPRKVIILLQAKGIDIDDIDDIDVIDIDMTKGEHLTEEFRKINPLQLLPVLVLQDGTVLNDSQAICEYLDRVYGERSVMGNDVVQRAQVCSIRRTAEFEVLYNFMLAFQHSHPSKAKRVDQVPEFAAKSIKRAEKVLPYFNDILKDKDYLVGDQLSYADIVFYIGLDFGRLLKFDPTAHGEGIARFYNSMNERFGLKK